MPALLACSCSLMEPPRFDPEAAAGREATRARASMRVATFNISGASELGRLAERIASDPEMRKSDVLMIQELAPELLTADLMAVGAAALGLPFALSVEGHVGAPGLGLLSRFPLERPEILPLPRFDLGYRSRARFALAADLLFEGERVRFYNVHLDTRLRLSDRFRQLRPVVERAMVQPQAVLGGDLNTIRSVPFMLPWIPIPLPGFSQARALDEHMRRHGFATPLEAVSWTGPLWMRLDALFARGLEAGDRGVVLFPGLSDHAALWLDLSLP